MTHGFTHTRRRQWHPLRGEKHIPEPPPPPAPPPSPYGDCAFVQALWDGPDPERWQSKLPKKIGETRQLRNLANILIEFQE